MRHLSAVLFVLTAVSTARPAPLRAQALDGVMGAIRKGGGWVSVDIVRGRGSASTLPIPTMGMTVAGCVRVFDGHSGVWRIRAHETVADTIIEVNSIPGQGIPFSHSFGLRSQFEVEVLWSEPRDTTLFLWVGVGDALSDPGVCVPKDAGAG